MGLDLNDYDFENPIGFDSEYSNFAKGKLKSKIKKSVSKIKEGAKKTFQAVNRINPAFALGRGGFLFIVRRNGFGLADRLAPLYLDDKDPVLRKYKPEAIKKVRDKRFNIENAWRNIGGAVNKYREAILDGRGRKPSIFKKGSKSFDGTQYVYFEDVDGNYAFMEDSIKDSNGYSNFIEPITDASITAGLTILTTVVKSLNSNGVPKQPFIEGTPEAKDIEKTPDGSQADPNAPTLSPDGSSLTDPKTGEKLDISEIGKENAIDSNSSDTNTSAQSNPDGTIKSEKFLGMPKKIGIGVTIGVGVLAIAGIVFAIVKKKK